MGKKKKKTDEKLNNELKNKSNKKGSFNNRTNTSYKQSLKVEPCSQFLGNTDPFVFNNLFIYDNQNRVYFFLSTRPLESSDPDTTLNTNLQISAANFFIGYYIARVQKKFSSYDKNFQIHPDKNINKLIHKMLKLDSKIKLPFNATLNTQVSNGNAIQPLVNYSIKISSINYLIVLTLFNIEKNPALFYGSNNYAFNNIVNYTLASQNVAVPADFFRL